MINMIYGLEAAMRAAGFKYPPNFIKPGKFYRFPGIGKSSKNRSGWCRLFEDGKGGCFGDWSSGYFEVWQAGRDDAYSPIERLLFQRKVEKAKERAIRHGQSRYAASAKRANAIWNVSTLLDCSSIHDYVMKKGIKPFGARLYKGQLVIPIVNFDYQITSLQFIGIDGKKVLLGGARKHGCFIHVSGDFKAAVPRIVICEGWATGCTLAENEPKALVLAAIDGGNLKPVAVSVRNRWPSSEIIIAGDDDRLTKGNPGATKAMAAAKAANAKVVFPRWPDNAPKTLSDFNDLVCWKMRSEK